MKGILTLTFFIIAFIAVYSIETFTMLWPVNPGTNRLSCVPMQKAQELNKEVLSISWFKWQPDDVDPWAWIGGVSYSDNQSKPSVTVDFDKRYTIHKNGVLEIQNITEKDNSNQYRCSARGPQGGFRESIQIKLMFFPKKEPSSIQPISDQINKTEGENLTLTCQASGTPPLTVSWIKVSGQRTNGNMLVLTNINRSEAGNYRCEASNEYGNSSQLVNIDVQFPASFTSFSPDQVTVEGDPASITLFCTADGNPTPNITWTKVYDNGDYSDVLFTGEQFVLNNNRNTAGTYHCKADNGIGSAMNQRIHVTIHSVNSCTVHIIVSSIISAFVFGIGMKIFPHVYPCCRTYIIGLFSSQTERTYQLEEIDRNAVIDGTSCNVDRNLETDVQNNDLPFSIQENKKNNEQPVPGNAGTEL